MMFRGVPSALLFTVVAAALATAPGCGNAANDVGTEQMELAVGATYGAGNTVQAEAFTSKSSPNPQVSGTTMGFFDAGTWMCFAGVDMTNVVGLDLQMAAANTGGVFSVRLDSNAGTEIGRYTVSTATGGWSTWQTRTM
jgi:hypothetical protein